jgi:hypothetical protein
MIKKGKWSIPTSYKGISFRSKLEADWARWFDAHQMRWVYESEGFDLGDGIWYMPDFWLPALRTIVEVKGILDDLDRAKLFRFTCIAAEHNIMVALAQAPVGENYQLCLPSPQSVCGDGCELNEWKFPSNGIGAKCVGCDSLIELEFQSDVIVAKCASCHSWYFLDQMMGWACPRCGFYDGNRTFEAVEFR